MKSKISSNTFIATVGLVFLFGSASSSEAQVKQVEMHIAGEFDAKVKPLLR